MLGQSMINVSAGARCRLSTFCSSIFLLIILLVAYPAINVLPVAALAGVMFNVVYQTFEWGSLRLIFVAALPKKIRDRFLSDACNTKIRRVDAFIIVLVTAVTLVADLAVAVGCGVAVACFLHVYDSSTMINTTSRLERDAEGRKCAKIYSVQGVLFFGSASTFLELFDVEGDPEDVRIIFESGFVSDFSALETLNKLGERYGELGKRVTLQLLHPGSSRIVDKASNLLVKEVTLATEHEKVLDSERFHHHIEGYTQSFSMPSGDRSMGRAATAPERHLRHRSASQHTVSSDLPQ